MLLASQMYLGVDGAGRYASCIKAVMSLLPFFNINPMI